jgi:hypothetical protein
MAEAYWHMNGQSNNTVIVSRDSLGEVDSARVKLATGWRLIFALVLIALEFSSLMEFLTWDSGELFHTASVLHISCYSVQALGYVVVAAVLVLDPGSLKKLFAQPLFGWIIVSVALCTWGMLRRAFNPPPGFDQYLFVRAFLLRLNALGFISICMVMFESDMILRAVKRAVAVVTLFEVAVDICETMHIGIFRVAYLDWNRAVGLQGDPNAAGRVVVFGCVIGLTAVPRRWRELFILACITGVMTTFSRESMLTLLVVILAAVLGRAIAPPRVLLLTTIAILVIGTWQLNALLKNQGVLDKRNLGRLEMETSDASAHSRAELAQLTLEKFEQAPLLGNGFGTTTFWTGGIESHDLYLSFMADYGILGVLMVPALVWCLRYRSWDYYGFTGAFLLWCLFSHTLFISPFALIAVAIMSTQQACFRSSAVSLPQYRPVPVWATD